MSESVLKKEFREADLQRLRNLVQGKTGERTSVSSGYTKDHVESLWRGFVCRRFVDIQRQSNGSRGGFF